MDSEILKEPQHCKGTIKMKRSKHRATLKMQPREKIVSVVILRISLQTNIFLTSL